MRLRRRHSAKPPAAAASSGALYGESSGPPARRGERAQLGNGVFLLLLLNLALFAADKLAGVQAVQSLYLNHAAPKWWQFVTCSFCHASWQHLSSNIFFVYVFGKLVEEEEGAFGVVFSYLVTGAGASLASFLLLPKTVAQGILGAAAATVSIGASGAVFGLFAIGVLLKLQLRWRKLLEVLILGQFVVERVMSEANAMAVAGKVGAGGINHVAHLAGALAGVLLIVLLNRALPPDE